MNMRGVYGISWTPPPPPVGGKTGDDIRGKNIKREMRKWRKFETIRNYEER
jgi:hypothetical protein